MRLPPPGTLMNIMGRKVVLPISQNSLFISALMIEEVERLDALEPYLHVPVDSKLADDEVFDQLSGNDPLFKAGLKSPLYSSWGPLGHPGGIG